MAHAETFVRGLVTGAGMNYPVVMKCPFEWLDFVDRVQITTGGVATIDSLGYIASAKFENAADQSVVPSCIILDTVWNKALLESHGLAITKEDPSFFSANDWVDILYLVPGMVLSMKVLASTSALAIGSKVTSAAAGFIKLLDVSANDEPAANIGYALTVITNGTGTGYVAVMVTL